MAEVIHLHNKVQTNPFPQDSSLYFKAYEVPLAMVGKSNFHAIQDHKAIARADENFQPILLGIVGSNYKVIQNKELFSAIEDQFMQSMTNEQLQGVKVVDQMSYNGAMCFRQYIFPKINAEVNSRSNVAFRTVIKNGFDGGSSFKLMSGAIDFFCTNGLIVGQYEMTTKRHTAGLTIPSMVDRVKRSIDVFYTQAEQWKRWAGKTISDDDAEEVFKAIPNISDRRYEQLLRQFQIEIKSHGRTVWALYSAATYYATHNEGEFAVRNTDNNHVAATLHNREMQVRSWLNTEAFTSIAA